MNEKLDIDLYNLSIERVDDYAHKGYKYHLSVEYHAEKIKWYYWVFLPLALTIGIGQGLALILHRDFTVQRKEKPPKFLIRAVPKKYSIVIPKLLPHAELVNASARPTHIEYSRIDLIGAEMVLRDTEEFRFMVPYIEERDGECEDGLRHFYQKEQGYRVSYETLYNKICLELSKKFTGQIELMVEKLFTPTSYAE